MKSSNLQRFKAVAALALLTLIMPLSLGGGLCGNGLIDLNSNLPEQCDDGNIDSGDGCSRLCQIESGWECTAPYLPLSQQNLIQDPGFEAGDGNDPWVNFSSFEPVICNVDSCPDFVGSRQGAWWGQLGGVANQNWGIKQALDNISTNQQLWLRFSVKNTFCSGTFEDQFGIFLDGQLVWDTNGADNACPNSTSVQPNSYRNILVDLRNSFPPGSAPTEFVMEASAEGNNFVVSIDNIQISPAAGQPVPSNCTLQTNVRAYEDFEGIGEPLPGPEFEQFTIGEFGLKWGTTDDGECGTFQNPPGNHTGEPGAAACIDSTLLAPRNQSSGGTFFIESYFCQAPVDLTFYTGSTLQLTVNYQPGSTTSQDFFGVWVDNQPFTGPLSSGVGNPAFITNSPEGLFGQAPGTPYTFEVFDVDLSAPVYVCFGYGNDGPGYAQVDTIILRNENCIDDFEEDKLGSCLDNCALVPNVDQTDSDNDGYGNACDADIAINVTSLRAETANGNDCVVNFQDLVVVADAFFSKPDSTNWNPDADFNNDGIINFLDLSIFSGQFLRAPGPSGITGSCGAGGGK